MSNPSQSFCPKCGATISADAPQGLCPRCVLAAAARNSSKSNPKGQRTPPPDVAEINAQFPDLEVLELIGNGGMGAVYKARQPKLDRFVALKILSADLADDPAFAERFNREARVLARLSHPHIVTVFDYGKHGSLFYLLMEHVDGVNLREAMQEGGFAPDACLTLVQEICEALKFAHGEGVLHRDIKPENVLIDSQGRVKIVDFGLAKLVGTDEPDSATLTGQGAVLGTMHYMAPEQWETPHDVDQRADIYSLGVVFYELLTGELPVGRFSPPSESMLLDPRVDDVVLRALERKRERRYQNVADLKTEIEAISRSHPIETNPAGAFSPTSSNVHSEFPWLAVVSAILTGLSLLLIPLTLFTLPALFEETLDEHPGAVMALGLLIVGLPALIGTLLGTRALGQIRESGGQNSGFAAAMFGTLCWPLLLVVAALGFAGSMLMFAIPVALAIPGIPLMIIGLCALGWLVAARVIRKVGRWSLAVAPDAPNPPRLKLVTMILCMAVAGWIGILLFFVAMMSVRPAGPYGEEMQGSIRMPEQKTVARYDPVLKHIDGCRSPVVC